MAHEKDTASDLDLTGITYEGQQLEVWHKKDVGEQSQAELNSTIGSLCRMTKKPIKATYGPLTIRNSDHGKVRHLSDQEVITMDQQRLAETFNCTIQETCIRSVSQTKRLEALLRLIVKHVKADGFFSVQTHVKHKNPELLKQFYKDMGNGLKDYNTKQDYHISVFYSDIKKLEHKYEKIHHKGTSVNRTFYLGLPVKVPAPTPAPEPEITQEETHEEVYFGASLADQIRQTKPITGTLETTLNSAKQEALTKFTESAGTTTTLLLQWLLIDK